MIKKTEMKKIFYLIGIFTLFLIISCDNEDITPLEPGVKGYTPTILGTFGKFTENNPESGIRAGVIEDYEDFVANGERFYWHNGDRVKVLFVDNANPESEPIELIYRAVVPTDVDGKEIDKLNTSDFEIVEGDGTVPEGNYTVYSLYPAEGWTKNSGGKWSVSLRGAYATNGYISILDESSKHAGQYMFMKAMAENVSIESGGSNAVDLSFKHLTSVIRVHVESPDAPELARLYRLSMGVRDPSLPEEPLGFESIFNPIDGFLEDLDATSLTTAGTINVARVQIPNDLLTNLNGLDFDLFIPILPTGDLASKTFTFVTSFYDEEMTTSTQANYIYKTIDREGPISFKAGRSYFFNLGKPDLP